MMSCDGKVPTLWQACFSGISLAVFSTILSSVNVADLHQLGPDGLSFILRFCGYQFDTRAATPYIRNPLSASEAAVASTNILTPPSAWELLTKIDKFISRGVYMNLKSFDGRTPIMQAAFSGNIWVVDFLIRKGVELTVTNAYSFNLIGYAVTYAQYGVLQYLETNLRLAAIFLGGLYLCGPSNAYWLQSTLLCGKDHIQETLSLLGNTGFFTNIGRASDEGVTPLHIATRYGNDE